MKKFSTLFSILLFTKILFSQTAQISGTVRDSENREPLTGASVKFDKTKGAITDASGKFVLNIPIGEHDLSISYIGYKTDKRQVLLKEGEKLNIEVAMKSSAIQISQVVTVSQYRKNSAKETVTTEVIGKNQIKNTNSNDIGEVVSRTPGVLVQDGQISIRGGSSYSYGVGSRVAVLSDGLSLMSADLGEGQSKMASMENVKQVEVIKGASSVVYGSGALNGVVNVVTEWPTDNDPKTEVELNYGIYDQPSYVAKKWWGSDLNPMFGSVNVNHQRRIKNLQLVAAGNITKNDGYLELSDEFRVRAVLKTRYLHPKVEGLNFGLDGLIMHERSNRFFISKNLDSLALFRATGSEDHYTRATLDPHFTYQNAKGHRISSNLRYMYIYREGGVGVANAVSHFVTMDNQYQFRWKNMIVLTAGFPFSYGSSSSNLYKDQQTNWNTAIYTQLEFNYKALTLQGGVRYEVAAVDTIIEKGIPVFRAGANVQVGRATFFRASFGQAYRIPSIAEKFISAEFFGGLVIVPNDTLKPERGWSAELGFKQGFRIGNWNAYFDASFFWQQYKNFIEYQLAFWPNQYSNGTQIFPTSLEYPGVPGQLFGLRALNVEQARIAGYEIGLAGTGKIGPVGVQLMAGYTYTWPGKFDHDTGSNHYTTSEFFKDIFVYNFKKVGVEDTNKLLYYRIRHLFRADVEVSFWKCYVGATFNYGTTPEKIPALFKQASFIFFHNLNALNDYVANHPNGDFFMDIRAGMNINDHFKIGFIVKNVTNRLYQLRPGKPEPLRSYTLQLRYTF
ncbi:MAG: TonB-dependent receptor [Bacteroidetes bacterium]|nr:TonB-dependent receptor [Bacteroidota bacterium]